MQPHIIALGFDQVDVAGGDADDLRRDAAPRIPGSRARTHRRGLRGPIWRADAGNSALQPFGLHRLQQIIHGGDIESRHREFDRRR